MHNSLSGCIRRPALPFETEVGRTAAQPKHAVAPRESIEDLVYSVIAASALVALLVGILSQLNSPSPGARSARTEWTSITETSSPSQGKDGKF
jgi:hypothetical protein